MTLNFNGQMRHQVYFYILKLYSDISKCWRLFFDLVSAIYYAMYEVKNDIVLKLLTKVTIIRDIVNVRLSETHAPGYFNFVLFFSNFIEMLYMYHNNTLIMLSCETTSYCFHICYICTCADSNFLPCLKKLHG